MHGHLEKQWRSALGRSRAWPLRCRDELPLCAPTPHLPSAPSGFRKSSVPIFQPSTRESPLWACSACAAEDPPDKSLGLWPRAAWPDPLIAHGRSAMANKINCRTNKVFSEMTAEKPGHRAAWRRRQHGPGACRQVLQAPGPGNSGFAHQHRLHQFLNRQGFLCRGQFVRLTSQPQVHFTQLTLQRTGARVFGGPVQRLLPWPAI